ncbi:MAG: pentapeptide repeat-containing protein [Pseudomonadota bacterium]
MLEIYLKCLAALAAGAVAWSVVAIIRRTFVPSVQPAWTWLAGVFGRWYFGILAAYAFFLALFWLPLLLHLGAAVFTLLDMVVESGERTDAYALGITLTALAAFAAAPLVLVRAFVAERQTRTAEQQRQIALEQRQLTEQGLVTDRLTKAVEQIGAEKTVRRQRTKANGTPQLKRDDKGNEIPGEPVMEEVTVPNLEVRLGGLYALERISKDSEADHLTVMEILCAYARQNGEWREDIEATREAREDDPDAAPVPQPPRVDVQTALTIIGRRPAHRLAFEQAQSYTCDLTRLTAPRADLTRAHLEGARLIGAHLAGARLVAAYLERARLNQAHLEGARLDRAHLEGAELYGAHLEGAELGGAHLEGARLGGAHLEGARLNGAHLEGARLIGAHLEGAKLYGAHLEGAWLFDADLSRAALHGSRLAGCVLGAARLRSASGLTVEGVNEALGVKAGRFATELPDDVPVPDGWFDASPYGDDSDAAVSAYQAWVHEQRASLGIADPA